jgi:archaellum component FlaC
MNGRGNAMIKITYSEIVKDQNQLRGKLVQRTKSVQTLAEAVDFSRYLANTVNLTGKPIVEEVK